MEIQGKIVRDLGETSGTSKAGNPWKKHEYVLETQETYPKQIAFNFFGDRASQYMLNVGDIITLSFDISSREFNGRWYTDISGWKAEKAGEGATTPPAPTPVQPTAPAPTADPFGAPAGGDDLPF